MLRSLKVAGWPRVVLAAWLGCALAGVSQSQSIGLVVKDGATVAAPVFASFQQQTELGLKQIVAGPELRVAWRAEGQMARGEVYDRLIVMHFRGDCSLAATELSTRRGPLGETWVTDGRILPFVEVDCGRVKETLARTMMWRRPVLSPDVLARALSRVALHEIYHVLTGRKHHDDEGLFKAEYSAEDLLTPRLGCSKRPLMLTEVAQQR